jgi:hypothetical protein
MVRIDCGDSSYCIRRLIVFRVFYYIIYFMRIVQGICMLSYTEKHWLNDYGR